MDRINVLTVRKKRIIRGRLKAVDAAINRCHGVPPCSDWKAWRESDSVNCEVLLR